MFRKWEVNSKIGEGSTGFVYKAKNVNSAEEVALKTARSLKYSMHLCREASILNALNHPNIMKLIDIPTKDPYNERMVLVMEYVEAGTLTSHIHFLRKFSERTLWLPMKQMSHGETDFNVENSPPTFARETLVSLLAVMLWEAPMERLTMTEIVNHTWFNENDPINYFRHKFIKHDQKKKPCRNTEHTLEPKMNKCLPSTTKKISCWKRLKINNFIFSS
uniref:uncharacterized protein n=1 Tax=Myxine glutinosa TaxID=7769 RepID=UPI00358DFAFF